MLDWSVCVHTVYVCISMTLVLGYGEEESRSKKASAGNYENQRGELARQGAQERRGEAG